MTQGRGVDVILSPLSGEGFKTSCECISSTDRFIEIGEHGTESNGNLPTAHFARHTSFAAVDLAGINRERPQLLRELLQSMIGLIHNGGDYGQPSRYMSSPSRGSRRLYDFCKAGEALGRLLSNGREEFNYPSVPTLSLFSLLVTD